MSEERQRERLQHQHNDIEMGTDEVRKSHSEQFTVKQLMKTGKGIETKLEKLNDTKRKDRLSQKSRDFITDCLKTLFESFF